MFFFFSSRRRHTRCGRDWSSDVCSSDLATARSRAKTPTDALTIEELRKDLTDYCSLGDRVVDQARRRILDGEQVPASEKLYSIFEPHTDLIKRGKINKPIEFGHKVFLAESAQGLITQYRVL